MSYPVPVGLCTNFAMRIKLITEIQWFCNSLVHTACDASYIHVKMGIPHTW